MISDWSWVGRLLENFGAGGLVAFVVWKIVDKWAGQFLDAQRVQANAMASLADAVKNAQADQREVLIAVRVLAREIEEQKAFLIGIEQELRKTDEGLVA
jgi:hypothetical protein